ncbi:acyl-CoA dehydrogenase family protein [Paraburkholderia unamae]|uniref:acyl-CoA dehydrogenase family protein n=1 Tax=Paraburkholderia unamae TaxID=219649 RepID=UPI000DD4E41E|nr:acyl-CoA dehydrogenase family protein [Paraburkholderia unamae]
MSIDRSAGQPLAQRFDPVFARIEAGTVARERSRELAHDAVQSLKASGFTALRVPQAYGGSGLSFAQFFPLLSRLAAADSNLPQILRAHFSFIEQRLESNDETARKRWFERIARGEVIGAATSERSGVTHNSVTLLPDPVSGKLQLNGEKYYSTGTLYADWISVAAHDDQSDLNVVIPAQVPGVARLDDWDGFGQRLTASGTTRFDAVAVDESWIVTRYDASQPRRNSLITAFLQTVHLATLAGIGQAVLRDSITFVQGRTRTFGVPGQSSPRENPLVQRTVGRIASLAYSTQGIVERLARRLDELQRKRAENTATTDDYIAADVETFQAQQIVIEQTLEAATLLFETGGASATSETLRFDRHWRNARTLASHNPAAQREAAIGDYYLNGKAPEERFSQAHASQGRGARVSA